MPFWSTGLHTPYILLCQKPSKVLSVPSATFGDFVTFEQWDWRPMRLNKNSHSCCKGPLFFAFLLEEQRSGVYMHFCRHHSLCIAFPWLMLSEGQLGHWPGSRACTSGLVGRCTLSRASGQRGAAGRQTSSLAHSFFLCLPKSCFCSQIALAYLVLCECLWDPPGSPESVGPCTLFCAALHVVQVTWGLL